MSSRSLGRSGTPATRASDTVAAGAACGRDLDWGGWYLAGADDRDPSDDVTTEDVDRRVTGWIESDPSDDRADGTDGRSPRVDADELDRMLASLTSHPAERSGLATGADRGRVGTASDWGAAREPAGPAAAQLMARVRADVRALARLALDGRMPEIPADTLVALGEDLHRTSDQLTAVAAYTTGAIRSTDALVGTAYPTEWAWLTRRCGKSSAQARAIIARWHDFRADFAATESAWLAGEVPEGAVREITQGVTLAFRGVGRIEQRSDEMRTAEEMLLGVARSGDVGDVATAVRHLRAVTDPDGSTQAQMDAYDEQQLRFRTVGASVFVTGQLDLENGTKLLALLDQRVERDYRTGSLERLDQPTGDDTRDRVRRGLRRPHLLALALAQVADDALGGGLVGTRHGVRPHVTVTADLDRVLAGLGGELLVPGQGTVPIPTATLQRILCDAEVHPVLVEPARAADGTDPASTDGTHGTDPERLVAGPAWRAALAEALRDRTRTVLWSGRSWRTSPPALRRALEVRDGHCTFPECAIDVTRCVVHHVLPWEYGGSTDPSNCVLLCDRHHHAVHEGGWSIVPTDGLDPCTSGYWQFAPPDRHDRPW